MGRVFEYNQAVRKSAPLLLGIVGSTGSGKTKSALRWATGIQSVIGGDIAVIDTEGGRALHYAEQHRFHHIPFSAPFGPLDYLDAIQFAVSKGATTVVVDSGSHMHEGPGGMLEQHDQELKRLGGSQRMSFPAWAKPKADLRRFINTLQQLRINLVMCFRAQDKATMPEKGATDDDGRPLKDLVNLGMMPIAPKGLIYEFSACPILMPGSKGVPTWQSKFIGEASVIKLPNYLEKIFADGRQLDEEHGRQMALWSRGDVDAKPTTAASKTAPSHAALLDFWEKQGVTAFALLRKLGRSSVGDITADDVAVAKTWATDLKNGRVSVDDIFQIGDAP